MKYLEVLHGSSIVYRGSQTSIDQKDTTEQELLMKGPGSFPLERLLAIFQCITSVAEDAFGEQHLDDGMATEGGKVGLMSDVLLQLSTLCNANFLCKSQSCPLEGSTRYRSTIDEETALKVVSYTAACEFSVFLLLDLSGV